jgi:hypothetical protein
MKKSKFNVGDLVRFEGYADIRTVVEVAGLWVRLDGDGQFDWQPHYNLVLIRSVNKGKLW